MDTVVDVIGLGGAGGFLASSLYQGGVRPRIVSRGAALKQLHEVGLTVASEGKYSLYTPISSQALDDVQQLAPIILLTTKSYDIPALLEEIAPRITSDTLLISVQNGFAAYDAIRNAFGPERAVMGVLYVSAQILSPAVIDIKPGLKQFFLPEQQRDRLEFLIDALNHAGVEAALLPDIERRMWIKQLFLVPFAIVNAEMRQPIGKLREDPSARARWAAIAQELADIAYACGISLPPDPVASSLLAAERFDPQADSSFARDVWANRPHEAEALFGPLLQRAQQHTISCPLLQQAYLQYTN